MQTPKQKPQDYEMSLKAKPQVNSANKLFTDCETDKEFVKKLKTLDQRGSIELIMGTMFAGKSTELLRRLTLQEIAGKRILRIKFSADHRYGNQFAISTHGGLKQKALPMTTLAELGDEWKQFDVIGIDEGQFFSDLVQFAETAANQQKIVIISALQGTFHRGKWQNITELIPLCEKIKKLSAICKLCKVNASFTFRTAAGNCARTIGGADMYMPLCRDCHERESRLNAKNAFDGNPELVNLKAENEAKEADEKSAQEQVVRIDAKPLAGQSAEDPKSLSTDMDSSSSDMGTAVVIGEL